MTTAKYQRLGYATELSSLLFRYRLAKCLVVSSLICVLLMAVSTLLYPRFGWFYFTSEPRVPDIPRNTSCVLPRERLIPKSPDGSYTPPPPDDTLFLAVDQAAGYDYNRYCERWDPEHGFPEEREYNANGECGTWQSDYIALHEKRLQDLERIKAGDLDGFDPQNRPEFVAYLCEEDPRSRQSRSCGGLADRMSGMISVFFYALLTDRAYLAHWHETAPIPLETLFEKPHINWSYEPIETKSAFDKNTELLSYEQINTLNVKWGPLGRLLFPDGREQNFKKLWNASFLEWRSNRAFIIRTFQESSIYPSMLEKVGLNKENAFYCLTDFLFRPTFGSRQFISAYKQLFQMNSILSIGLQIRTGDQDIINPGMDDNTLEKWNYFWQCANELRDYARKPHHRRVVYFLITDSAKLRDEFVSMNHDEEKARSILGDSYQDITMVVTGLPIQHIEAKTIKNKYSHNSTIDEDREQMIAGVNSAVIENWILSFTDYRLISRQGFGKLAAFHSQSSTTTISMPMFDDRENTQFCGDPDAFITFDELSVWWSLG